MALLNFDAAQVAPAAPMEVIPAGTYNAMMVESEMKPTKMNDGAYLSCTFEILDGEYKGRKVFTNLNLQNQNPTAVEIAYRSLSAICHAVGVIQCQDSAQLHNRPLQIVVKVKPATGEYEAGNEIKGYKAIQQAAPAAAPGVMPPPTAPAAAPAAWTPPAAPVAPVAPVVAAPSPVPAAPAPTVAPAPGTPPWAAAPVPAAPAPAAPAAPAPVTAIPQAAAVPPWMQQPAG